MGRTQGGNNNAYCQDNEISWFDWSDTREHWTLLEFTQRLTALRARHPIFRRRRWFQGRPIHGQGCNDVEWFRPDGTPMTDEDWSSGFAKSVAIFLNGDAIPDPDVRGERVVDDSFLVLFNAHYEPIDFVMPEPAFGERWDVEIDTNDPMLFTPRSVKTGESLAVEARSLVALKRG
jgi:glycogen operon protein